MAGNITFSIMNKGVWDGLSEANRTAIRKVSDEMIQIAATTMRESAANGLKELAKLGQVYELTPEEKAEVAAATSPVFDKVTESVKGGPGAAMIEKLASYRK
jgi:TRAP-type C4-dicarboxylate transport system substrate-binding protein